MVAYTYILGVVYLLAIVLSKTDEESYYFLSSALILLPIFGRIYGWW